MKKFLYIAIIGGLIWSCGGSDDPPPTPPDPENNAPTVPVQVYPSDKELCIDNAVNFQWNASTDPDGDAISYIVEVSENSNFPSSDTQTKTTSSTSISISIDKGTVFYWRVKATDNEDDSNFSSNNEFYTEGEGIVNHLPFSPDLVAPTLDVVVKETDFSPNTDLNAILEWTASDVDTEDTLTFDVYFGEVTDPTTVVSADQAGTTYNATLTSGKDYYWKIVVKDGNGGETIGQIWKFKTD